MCVIKKISLTGILFISCCYISNAYSNVVSCTGSGTTEATWNIQANKLTVGTDTPPGTLIYTEPDGDNNQHTDWMCGTDGGLVFYIGIYLRLDNTSSPIATYTADGHNLNVYLTGVKGIGVSFQDITNLSYYPGRSLSTTDLLVGETGLGPIKISMYNATPGVRMRLWRTAEPLDISALNSGLLTSIFPRVIQDMNTEPSSGYEMDPPGFHMMTITYFNGSNLKIVPGTCDLPDVTVSMGNHDNSEMPSIGSGTAWIAVPDLKLINCPTAYGYGAIGAGSNTSQNNVSVTVSPRTEIVSNLAGTFAVNDGEDSASGYGIQLAWGKSSELTDTPATLVEFNKPYLLKEFPYGDSTSSTIPIALAARYIRTSSVAKGGEANAIIDVLVNYK